jgi:hypothetical protein
MFGLTGEVKRTKPAVYFDAQLMVQRESTEELFCQEAPEKLTDLLSSSSSDEDCRLTCHALRLKR